MGGLPGMAAIARGQDARHLSFRHPLMRGLDRRVEVETFAG